MIVIVTLSEIIGLAILVAFLLFFLVMWMLDKWETWRFKKRHAAKNRQTTCHQDVGD